MLALSESSQITLGDDPRPRIQTQLHLTNLFIDVFHELNDEVDEEMFGHLFRVEVGDEE